MHGDLQEDEVLTPFGNDAYNKQTKFGFLSLFHCRHCPANVMKE